MGKCRKCEKYYQQCRSNFAHMQKRKTTAGTKHIFVSTIHKEEEGNKRIKWINHFGKRGAGSRGSWNLFVFNLVEFQISNSFLMLSSVLVRFSRSNAKINSNKLLNWDTRELFSDGCYEIRIFILLFAYIWTFLGFVCSSRPHFFLWGWINLDTSRHSASSARLYRKSLKCLWAQQHACQTCREIV